MPKSLLPGDIVIGYFWAVTAATLAFVVIQASWLLANGGIMPIPIRDQIGLLVLFESALAILFWAFAAVAALVPFVCVYRCARWWKMESVVYYVVCGAATGLLVSPLFVYLAPGLFSLGLPEDADLSHVPLVHLLALAGPALTVVGACGGIAFWWWAGDHIASLDRSREQSAKELSLPN